VRRRSRIGHSCGSLRGDAWRWSDEDKSKLGIGKAYLLEGVEVPRVVLAGVVARKIGRDDILDGLGVDADQSSFLEFLLRGLLV